MLELKVKTRNILGKKVKFLRKKGILPGAFYGPRTKPTVIEMDYNEFEKVFEKAGESTIIKLKLKDSKNKERESTKNVLVYGIERDPLTDKLIHVDFYVVRMDKPITAEIPLVFEGESAAVENLDGTLVENIKKIEVEALPADLPHEIKIDISSLETFDDVIHIKDIKIDKKVKILAELEDVIVSITPPRTKEELAALEEEVEEKTEEVEKVGEEEAEVSEGELVKEEPIEEKSAEEKSSSKEKKAEK